VTSSPHRGISEGRFLLHGGDLPRDHRKSGDVE